MIGLLIKLKCSAYVRRIPSSAYEKAMYIFSQKFLGKRKNRQFPQPASLLVVMSWHCKSSSSLALLFWEMRREQVPTLLSAPWGEGHFQIPIVSLLRFSLYIDKGLTIYFYDASFSRRASLYPSFDSKIASSELQCST